MTFYDYLKQAIEELGEEASLRSYSGRAMYGDSCVGLVTDMGVFVRIMGHAAVLAHEDDDCDIDFLYEAGRIRTDNMGMSTIFYWPNQKWADISEDEEDEDND